MPKAFRYPSTASVVIIYVCLSVAWVLVGDLLERRVVGEVAGAWGWQTLKGLTFVALSALVLGWFGTQRDRAEARQREQERELHERNRLYRAMFE